MASDNRHEFSLRKARVNSGHSKRSLARELGIAYGTLIRLERGQPVHPANAKVVADFFGVQVTDLMPAPAPDDDKAAAA
jgi:DNA-binding XRE family transcriptional regulator